ncbi:unnamed protein product [Paramecium sonneborni]|uniref:Uncharacterized protein n=1 Tax=Paramecium sonneborni TaxID=65129 RepID=A0A8S1RMV2_9CILI|nr:unnamed protein product [Paramecium sonneborni]
MEQTIEKEVENFNFLNSKIEKIHIQIKFNSNQQIIYSQNRVIVRVTQGHDVLDKKEMFNNMDQIHNLSWQGYYGKNKENHGKWIAFWNKDLLINVGGQSQIIYYILCYKDGQKKAPRKDPFLNDMKQSQILETGEYYYDFRIGKWNIIFQNVKIGGGIKQGKWVELDEGFYLCNRLLLKIGLWDIMYDGDGKRSKQLQKIYKNKKNVFSGGGSYDQEGNQQKIGKWVEIDDGYYKENLVIYNGLYNIKGKKIGLWCTMQCFNGEKEYKQIGGGQYDQEGNQKKIGRWVKLDEGFSFSKYVIHNGEYNINGMKVGKWDILHCNDGEEEYKQIISIKSGGGLYDYEGTQKIQIQQYLININYKIYYKYNIVQSKH